LGLIYKNALKPLHDNVVQPGVDKGLKILHGVWTKIVPAVPKAAQAASLEIAGFYESTVNELAAAALIFGSGGKPLLSLSLPVVDGSTHKLCMKAFDAIEGALDMPFQNTPLKDIGAIAIEPIKALINGLGASDQFCELGDSGSSDTSQALKQLGKNQCDSNQSIKDQCQKASDAQAKASRVAAACSGWSPDLNPPKPMPDPDCPNVQALQDTADSEQQLCDDGQKRCQDKTNDAANNVPKNATPGQGSSQGKEPAKVDDNWWNGTDPAQLLAVERGDGKSVTYSPKFVKVASQGRVEMADPSDLKGQTFSLSQAEFFYDKGGDWDTVNADEDAMWNFHWRARFRLVNPKVFGAQGVILDGVELELGAKIGSGVVTNPSLVPAKVTLARDVLNLTPPMSMVLH
ncbi:MAG: hypothetical protein JOZ69_11970, partial [Myxococcales bacterium]|nr:hypothetical protein [Myxococcales bacterium]